MVSMLEAMKVEVMEVEVRKVDCGGVGGPLAKVMKEEERKKMQGVVRVDSFSHLALVSL